MHGSIDSAILGCWKKKCNKETERFKQGSNSENISDS